MLGNTGYAGFITSIEQVAQLVVIRRDEPLPGGNGVVVDGAARMLEMAKVVEEDEDEDDLEG